MVPPKRGVGLSLPGGLLLCGGLPGGGLFGGGELGFWLAFWLAGALFALLFGELPFFFLLSWFC